MLEQSSSTADVSAVGTTSKPKKGSEPSSDELECLYKKLSEAGKPALLSLVPGYCEAYTSLYDKGMLPLALPYMSSAWQHNMVPTPSTVTHGFTGVADNFCECLK